jgi:hypothetical protein
VRHTGTVSFQNEKPKRLVKALRQLDRLHPDYHGLVRAFVQQDPLLPARRRLDLARLRRQHPTRPVCFITHNWGGGTERHVRELVAWLAEEGSASLILRPDVDDHGRVAFTSLDVPFTSNVVFSQKNGTTELGNTLRALGVTRLHVHHLAGFGADAPRWLADLANTIALPYDVTLHDYWAICPRIHLIGKHGIYCGEPPVAQCQRCVDTLGTRVGPVDVKEWRRDHAELLLRARRVFAPSHDVAERFGRYVQRDILVRPHPEQPPMTAPASGPSPKANPGARRVAVIGAIGPTKGSALLLALARDARARRLPLYFVLFGHTDLTVIHRESHVTVTGEYADFDLARLLAENPCDLALFCSVWPETYSYTLSAALWAKLFPVAFDFGAMAERIRACGFGALLPTDLMTRPGAVNDALLALAKGDRPTGVLVKPRDELYPGGLGEYFDLVQRQDVPGVDRH